MMTWLPSHVFYNNLLSVQDKNPVTQVLHYAKPGLQGFCPVLNQFAQRRRTKES